MSFTVFNPSLATLTNFVIGFRLETNGKIVSSVSSHGSHLKSIFLFPFNAFRFVGEIVVVLLNLWYLLGEFQQVRVGAA